MFSYVFLCFPVFSYGDRISVARRRHAASSCKLGNQAASRASGPEGFCASLRRTSLGASGFCASRRGNGLIISSSGSASRRAAKMEQGLPRLQARNLFCPAAGAYVGGPSDLRLPQLWARQPARLGSDIARPVVRFFARLIAKSLGTMLRIIVGSG